MTLMLEPSRFNPCLRQKECPASTKPRVMKVSQITLETTKSDNRRKPTIERQKPPSHMTFSHPHFLTEKQDCAENIEYLSETTTRGSAVSGRGWVTNGESDG